jgi:DNA repair protein RadB
MDKIPTGSDALDWLLDGGSENGIITTLFGPPGSGKSNIAMLFTLNLAKSGKKVIFIDTENSFSSERAKQLLPKDISTTMQNVIILTPFSFKEQCASITELPKLISKENVAAIIIDSIAMLYRLEKGYESEVAEANRDLAKSLSVLSKIARKYKIPILITDHMYTDFETKKQNIVGGDILKYWSKCLIYLEPADGFRRAVLHKHRSIKEGKEVYFEIRQNGIFKVPAKKKFSLFG